jgi:hypothetical protein
VIDPNQDNSESKLGRLTNYKIATGQDDALPKLSQALSYIHPEMKKLYKE